VEPNSRLWLFASARCVCPSYAGGDPEDVERKLLLIVPLGSPLSRLQEEVERRQWHVPFEAQEVAEGSPTFLNDTHLQCRGVGGKVLTVHVADYWSPFRTVVETQWLYDQHNRLRDICVRKTVDAL
jgi:hypothetical protein